MSNASVVMQPVSASLSPLSPLTSPSPLASAAQNNISQHSYGTRKRQNSIIKPSQRVRENTEPVPPAQALVHSVRRIRPLGYMTSNTSSNTLVLAPIAVDDSAQDIVKERSRVKSWRESGGAWKAGTNGQVPQAQQVIDFPPKHVVLHPDDANSKVFLAVGRAFMSVDNRAMTVKDLAELSMKHGLVCQNVSAAAQAITFFIRSHLHRCEVEEDFPLLLRHVLSGTPKDDALAPALYSRSGGNVSKDKSHVDENGKEISERKTCFRRGTTVWYLSKAAGAPCPFARNGIALRDYSEVSAITGAESRKSSGLSRRNETDADLCRGMKRKREREGLRRRTATGAAMTACGDDSEAEEGRKPPKIKLTLRLRLTSVRDKSEAAESSSSSEPESDSDSDSRDDSMSVDESLPQPRPVLAPPQELRDRNHQRKSSWTFPPYPIQRRISIPPYTPSEETYPSFYPSHSTSSTQWATSVKPKLEPTCVESSVPSGSGTSLDYQRALSVPASIASPPPASDSEDEFGFGDDEGDQDFSFAFSPVVKHEEDPFAYIWPQAAPSVVGPSHGFKVKSEPNDEFADGLISTSSKRSSTQTMTPVKPEELDFNFDSLSLSFDSADDLSLPLGLGIKQEDDDDVASGLLSSEGWGQPVDMTPLEDLMVDQNGSHMASQWKNVELLGPNSVRLQDLERGWEELGPRSGQPSSSSSPPQIHEQCRLPPHSPAGDQTPLLSPAHMHASLSPAMSMTESGPSWVSGSLSSLSSSETDLESIGPTSPPPFYDPESPVVARNDEMDEDQPPVVQPDVARGPERSSPWTIPSHISSLRSSGKETAPRRLRHVIADIPVSDASTPWERGMLSQQDLEEHLLPVLSPFAVENSNPTLEPLHGSFLAEQRAAEPPLSPQEEEVFQSFCLVPDADWDAEDGDNGDMASSSRALEVSFAEVFAAVTRPKMHRATSSGKRGSTKLESKRLSLESPKEEPADEQEEDADADDDSSKSTRGRTSGSAGSKPLRRSKRVATAVATQTSQQARGRLRKRTTTAS